MEETPTRNGKFVPVVFSRLAMDLAELSDCVSALAEAPPVNKYCLATTRELLIRIRSQLNNGQTVFLDVDRERRDACDFAWVACHAVDTALQEDSETKNRDLVSAAEFARDAAEVMAAYSAKDECVLEPLSLPDAASASLNTAESDFIRTVRIFLQAINAVRANKVTSNRLERLACDVNDAAKELGWIVPLQFKIDDFDDMRQVTLRVVSPGSYWEELSLGNATVAEVILELAEEIALALSHWCEMHHTGDRMPSEEPLSEKVEKNLVRALEFIKANPGKKALVIAKHIGLAESTFRKTYVPLLKSQGVLSDDGYRLADSSESQA